MKSDKNSDKIKDLDGAGLAARLEEARERMFRLRFQLSMGTTEGVKKLRLLRKDAARILTEQRGRELNPEHAPAGNGAGRGAGKKGK